MIYITGDCHGDWRRFSSDNFPEQKGMTKDDFVIVCGDFGLWHDTKEERYNLKWLDEKPFTTLFVDGNHENFDRLYSDEFEEIDFHGGRAHKIRESIYHLMRGQVFGLGGKSFFTFGGASSHDISGGILNPSDFKNHRDLMSRYNRMTSKGKLVRINHETWWKEEMPSREEMQLSSKTLDECENKVDYIITHCCPQSVSDKFSDGFYKQDDLTLYFDEVAKKTDFGKWFFGHYHDDKIISDKFILLYEQIVLLMN